MEDPVEEVFERARRLPAGAVAAVFQRYGKPLEAALPPVEPDDQLAEIEGGRVRVLQVRLPVDVLSNDWFVLETPGEEPVGVPGPLFAAALAALASKL